MCTYLPTTISFYIFNGNEKIWYEYIGRFDDRNENCIAKIIDERDARISRIIRSFFRLAFDCALIMRK